jgi:hypothetical protein
MTMRVVLALAAIFLLLTSCRDEYAAIPVLSTEWKVHGKLTDKSTGSPVADAKIYFHRAMVWPSWCSFCEPTGSISVSIRSGQDGMYFYSSNVPGFYTMSISKDDKGCKRRFINVPPARDIRQDYALDLTRPCPLIM